MQMRMEKQVLSPTVKYGEKADLGAQMLRIGSDRFGNGEDDMKIGRRENFGRSFFNPLRTSERLALWTVAVAAAVVTGPLVIAAVAALEMTAESCGSAHLDRGHDAPLSGG